LTKLKLF